MLRVYLDQAHWISLGKAQYGRRDAAWLRRVLDMAQEATVLGLASFPLSLIHYLETYNQRDPAKRWRLARVMGRISKFHALAPLTDLLPFEIDLALQRRFGLPGEVRRTQVFGQGVAHAIGDPNLGPWSTWLETQGDNEESRFLWELFSLAGPMPQIEGSEEIDMETYKQPASDFEAAERRLATTFRNEQWQKGRRSDLLAARELNDLFEPVREAMARAGIPEGYILARGKDGLNEFLEDLPTRHVAFALRQLRHDNRQEKWSRTDLGDMGALAAAVPYCDVVVTEKRWVHLSQQADLGERYETLLLARLEELPDVLLDATRS